MRTFKILFVVGVVIAVTIASLTNPATTTTVSAQSNAAPGQAKKYRATRPIVVDAQTGALRMPTEQEIDQTVSSLTSLAKNAPDAGAQASAGGGAVSLDLGGGLAGVMLARPNGDGTWETKCVFTLEEGAEFLGLVEDNQPR